MTPEELYVYAWLAVFVALLLYAGWKVANPDDPDDWHRQHSLWNWHDPDDPDLDD